MSDDLRAEVRAAVVPMLQRRDDEAVRERRGEPGRFDRELWADLVEGGFTLLGVDEARGGSGGGLPELAVVLEEAARAGAAVPLAETALAAWLLSSAGLTVPTGVVVVALDEATAESDGQGLVVSGRLQVPWGRHADSVVVLVRHDDRDAVALVPVSADVAVEHGVDLAGEPRDVLVLDRVPVAATGATSLGGQDLLRRGALLRAVQMAGAAQAVLASTLQHVAEREQFGRPLARFQAVQQHLSALAAEVAAMHTGAGAALLAVQAADAAGDPAAAEVAVAAAKAVASSSAHVVASTGHQLHGALGYTREHALHEATTRLWSWRDEFGAEALWQDRLAVRVQDQAAWWSVLTA